MIIKINQLFIDKYSQFSVHTWLLTVQRRIFSVLSSHLTLEGVEIILDGIQVVARTFVVVPIDVHGYSEIVVETSPYVTLSSVTSIRVRAV